MPTLQVKLAGDGTRVGRKLNLINFTFTLLNEGSSAKSAAGNHTLAVINARESYEDMKLALRDLRAEVNELKSIIVNEDTYQIEYFLC